jgi:hypothetical protein
MRFLSYYYRSICRLRGCCCHEQYPGCFRCGCGIYDCEYIEHGKLEPVVRFRKTVSRWIRKQLVWPRCKGCKLKMRYYSKDEFCSWQCEEGWLPF